jgi:hypothetical protein
MLTEINSATKKYNSAVLEKHRAIRQNYLWSSERLKLLRGKIGSMPGQIRQEILTIAVVGSYGRFDASKQSDFDRIVILRDGFDMSNIETFETAFNDFLDPILLDLKLAKSNPKGVFTKPILKRQIVSIAGDDRETYADLSRRVLMLLESTDILAKAEYDSIIDQIIAKYAEDVVRQRNKNFVFLMNDVIRYFRTICVNYQYTKESTEWGKWPIRNTKLRHSRIIMYISLIAAIGLLGKYEGEDKLEALRALISLEPLRRLYVAYVLSEDDGFFRVAEYYNVFLAYLNRDVVREKLNGLEYDVRYDSEEFAVLKANSDALAAELWRFFEGRKGQWNDRFFEYMIL